MKSLKISVALSLDEILVKKLRKVAEEDNRTLSSCINLILRNFLSNKIANTEKVFHTGSVPKPSKIKVSVSLDGPIVEKLRILAEDEDRALSSYVNLILHSHLRNLEAKEKDG